MTDKTTTKQDNNHVKMMNQAAELIAKVAKETGVSIKEVCYLVEKWAEKK